MLKRTRPIRFLAIFSVVLFLLLQVKGAHTAERPLATRDFKNLRELKTGVEGVLYRVPLEALVYKGLARSHYRDLAVFNARGEIVPFEVMQALPQLPETPTESEARVPFFELPAEAESESPGALDVYVQTGRAGQVVEVKSSANPEKNLKNRQYLLDLTAFDDQAPEVRALRLALPEEGKFALEASLLESDTLRNWIPLASGIPLIRLENKDTKLSTDKVDLPRNPMRYLLLRIEKAEPGFELRDVVAVTASRPTGAPVLHESAAFDGAPSPDGRTLFYDTLGAFPLEKIDFPLKEAGLYRARISSRPDANAEWRRVGEIELSMIQTGDSTRRNTALPIHGTENRYWRLDFDAPFSAPVPQMHLFWQGRDLYFLAQGGAPYILAFGNADPALRVPVTPLPNDPQLRRAAATAAIGEAPKGAPQEIKSPVPEAENEWQRYMVWGLLIFGGVLLSLMAWKLLKSERTEGPPPQ